jgi:hypothetical protein
VLNGYHLSLLIGPVETSPVPEEVIDSLTSVSIKESAGERSGFSLTFTTSKNSRIQRDLLPSGYFEPIATRVQIVVTIGGSPTVLMDGFVSRLAMTPSNDPNKTTFTVTGEDVSLAMDLIDLTGIPYPCMPPELRVLMALGRYPEFGVIPEVVPSIFVDVPIPIDKIPMHQGTDLAYIKYLAGETGYVFYVTPGPVLGMNQAYWGPEIRWGEVQPALSINLDDVSNLDSLSFSFDGLSGTIYAMMAQIPSLCASIPIPLPPFSVLRPPLSAVPAIPHKIEILSGTNNEGPIRAAMLGLARAAQKGDALTGNGAADVLRTGRLVRARQLVDIRGAGLACDGTYYVTSVSHDIKRGSFKQSFTVVREGLVPLEERVQT